jgi:hypothetical protein
MTLTGGTGEAQLVESAFEHPWRQQRVFDVGRIVGVGRCHHQRVLSSAI